LFAVKVSELKKQIGSEWFPIGGPLKLTLSLAPFLTHDELQTATRDSYLSHP